jgi:hypothetical protein
MLLLVSLISVRSGGFCSSPAELANQIDLHLAVGGSFDTEPAATRDP